MANTTQDEIYKNFLEASQQQPAKATEANQSLAGLISQADQVRQDMSQQTARTASSPGGSSTKSAAGTSGAAQSSVLSSVFNIFKAGLGVSPLVKGIFSLFGGGGSAPAPAPLVKYALPPSIGFQAAEVGGQVMNADYGQAGTARAYGAAQAPSTAQAAPASGGSSAAGGSQAPQITVNVSAMDSRSFMDRSTDIAAAVREAMLNLNPINDVVSEL